MKCLARLNLSWPMVPKVNLIVDSNFEEPNCFLRNASDGVMEPYLKLFYLL